MKLNVCRICGRRPSLYFSMDAAEYFADLRDEKLPDGTEVNNKKIGVFCPGTCDIDPSYTIEFEAEEGDELDTLPIILADRWNNRNPV